MTHEQAAEHTALTTWTDDEIVNILKLRRLPSNIQSQWNGWSIISLVAAAELMRMVRDDLNAEVARLTQRVEELEAQLEDATGANRYLVSENSMLFDRAARRLAYIKQLEATLAELGWTEDDDVGR
jgi:hypothetical protein